MAKSKLPELDYKELLAKQELPKFGYLNYTIKHVDSTKKGFPFYIPVQSLKEAHDLKAETERLSTQKVKVSDFKVVDVTKQKVLHDYQVQRMEEDLKPKLLKKEPQKRVLQKKATDKKNQRRH